MTVVGDTGPIIGLAKIAALGILQRLAGEVLIPPAVYRELLGKTGPEAAAIDRALQQFLHVTPPGLISPVVARAVDHLGGGERQAIGLASRYETVLLLLDDQAGRSVARRLGIPVTGVLGVLLRAKENGWIEQVSPLLTALQDAGYWLSEEVVEQVKKLAGEG